MEDGKGACANLAKAAAALTVLSLLPVAFGGSAPSHASAGLLPISAGDLSRESAAVQDVRFTSLLFGSFVYIEDRVVGTYVNFNYNASSGSVHSYLATGAVPMVMYFDAIDVGPFAPFQTPTVAGPRFDVLGYDIEITAHDDPTGLLEIRSAAARNVTITLPYSATNISQHATVGSWPASSLSYSIGEEHARFVLGVGTFGVNGTQVVASMAEADLLVFKAVPTATPYQAEWRAVLDAISAGQLVAELDLIATSDGRWIQNSAWYRIDVTAWPREVTPGKASLHVGSLTSTAAMGGAVVLVAFDPDTMPADATRELRVRVNGVDVNATADTLGLFYSPGSKAASSAYTVLALPGTVLAIYLPSLEASSVEVVSAVPPSPPIAFQPDSALALSMALLLIAAAASFMFRRRTP